MTKADKMDHVAPAAPAAEGAALHRGSCHCGKVAFEVTIDLATAGKCNCRICQKLGVVGGLVKPAAFRQVKGEDEVFAYGDRGGVGNRFFCKTCGVYCFSRGHLEFLGGDFVSVNVNTLDDIEHADLKPSHVDGRHDNWMAGPRPQPWPTFAEGEVRPS